MRDQIWNTSIFLLRKIESHWYSRMSLVLSQLRRLWLDSQPKKKEEEDFDSATINEDII